jgi:hypothetical protein
MNVKGRSEVAQKITTLFIDDIDGGEAEGTVRFAHPELNTGST